MKTIQLLAFLAIVLVGCRRPQYETTARVIIETKTSSKSQVFDSDDLKPIVDAVNALPPQTSDIKVYQERNSKVVVIEAFGPDPTNLAHFVNSAISNWVASPSETQNRFILAPARIPTKPR